MTRASRWLPAITAAGYLATILVEFRGLVHALYWDTDISAPFVLVARLRGHGTVYISHYAEWTSLWWLAATRHLPGHVQLWEGTGYAFALIGVALVAWATRRVAGNVAAVAAGAVSLIVGPIALRSLLTVNFHVTTPFTAAVLAWYLVLLPTRRSRLLAALVGVLVGANAASDPLLWVGGIVPFALAAAVLARAKRRVDIGIRASIVIVLAIVCAALTSIVMGELGFKVATAPVGLAHPGSVPSSVALFARMVALLGGANYALPHGYPHEPLRVVVAALAALAVASPIAAAIVAFVRRWDAPLRAFATYWAAVSILLFAVFVTTTNAPSLGAGSVTYLLTLPLAAGAGVGLLVRNRGRFLPAAAVAIALVGATNMAGVAQGRAGTPKGAVGTYKSTLEHLLVGQRATHGYAGYWDAQNLSWQTGMKLVIAPVFTCQAPDGKELCASTYWTIASWYKPRSERSFLLVDPANGFVAQAPRFVSDAVALYRFGRLSVYVFAYDLARKIYPPA